MVNFSHRYIQLYLACILNNTKTAAELTAYLMDTFFSRETMATSNMNGGGKKGYQQLNPTIVNALRGKIMMMLHW